VSVRARWEWFGLGAILLLAADLDIVGLNREAYGNTYYAAAVKSMLTSWPNFFFVSFDSGGFVSVDKPPVGLWVQAASAWLFGFNGLSLLLPQAIAGVLAVALLYYLVRRAFGPAAGLLAALALAVTPITVVTDRNNTMDSQLVLALLLAVWAATFAAESGRLRPLLVCAALMGLAYNIKMLQAYLVLPALWAAYLLLAPIAWRTRIERLSLATVVLLAVSLSWSIGVDLTPVSARPASAGSPRRWRPTSRCRGSATSPST
jgi:4-amino-4-deoxy-L-arabinose transferase-like glycosyltransferase